MRSAIRIGVCAAGLAGAISSALAAPVVIGMSLPLSGPDAALGFAVRDGARLAVARANAAGRSFELLVSDDGGEPRRAAANANQLLQAQAVALAGVFGAPATRAVAEVLAPAEGASPRAALVAPFTSADSLRTPPLPGVFHLWAGAAEQASAALLHLDTLGVERYALVVQDDELGKSAFERLQFELTRIAIRPVAVERLQTGTKESDLQRAMSRVCDAQAQALVLVLDAAHAAQALQTSIRQRCASQHLVFSDTGAQLAARHVVGAGPHPFAGLLVTQVVPHPGAHRHPLVAEFHRERLARGEPAASHFMLAGYLTLRLVVEAAAVCGREPERKCVLNALATRSFDLPGARVEFGSAQRQSRPFVEINLLDAAGRLRH